MQSLTGRKDGTAVGRPTVGTVDVWRETQIEVTYKPTSFRYGYLTVLASFLDLIGLTVLMWAVGKDLAHHDLRIFKLEMVEKRQTEEIARLNAWLDVILHREDARP